MAEDGRDIVWKRPALLNFLSKFKPTKQDHLLIRQKLTEARRKPDDAQLREPVSKDVAPGLTELQGELYASRTGQWYVVSEWLPEVIWIVHVDNRV